MVPQARNAAPYFAEQPVKPANLLRDHDGKLVPAIGPTASGPVPVPTGSDSRDFSRLDPARKVGTLS